MTRADRIRKMTDEELKELFCGLITEDCNICFAHDRCSRGNNGYMNWLKEEVGESKNEVYSR